MTGQDIIDKFHTYTDDQSELSSSEELDLLNNIYQDVYTDRHWEWCKVVKTGTLDSYTTSDSHITMPTDFRAFAENNSMTDNTFESDNNAAPKVVFIISPDGTYIPYQVINFSDRRQYQNKNGFCYLDLANSKIVFTTKPQYNSYEFDYIYRPPALTLLTSPVFNSDYHQILVHGMAIDHEIIALFDRAHSYAPENRAKYQEGMQKLAYDNAHYLVN